MQSVYKSFFARYGEGQFELELERALVALDHHHPAQVCESPQLSPCGAADVPREVAWQGRADRKNVGWDLVDREPTPLEAAVLADTVNELFRGMDEPDRETVSMLLQGYTAQEVAASRSCSERTVRRVRSRVKERLKRLYAADSGPSA